MEEGCHLFIIFIRHIPEHLGLPRHCCMLPPKPRKVFDSAYFGTEEDIHLSKWSYLGRLMPFEGAFYVH